MDASHIPEIRNINVTQTVALLHISFPHSPWQIDWLMFINESIPYCSTFLLLHSSTAEHVLKPPSDESTKPTNSKTSKKVLLSVRVLIGISLLIAVLGSSVLSKLTLFSLTDRLRYVTTNESSGASAITQAESHTTTVTIYWYLQFVLLIPSIITFTRSLVVGVVGKTTKSFPWPTWRAIILVS